MHNGNAKLLREFRTEARLTQEKAAGRAGVSLASWRNWEAGRALPATRQLPAIAEALGVSLTDLLPALNEITLQMLGVSSAA